MNGSMPSVLIVGADEATRDLLHEWLSDAGWRVVDEPAQGPSSADATRADAPFALVLVDVPFPRRDLAAPLQRVALEHAGAPVLALSATFHASVEHSAAVARALGVAGVLPKPVRREALVDAVRHLSRRPPR